MRSGRWIFRDTVEASILISKGRFKKGVEVGTWKHFDNKKLIKKETYEDSIAKVWFYHLNGKVRQSGKTKLAYSSEIIHWFYYGEWSHYDQSGKLVLVEIYEAGNLLKETPIY